MSMYLPSAAIVESSNTYVVCIYSTAHHGRWVTRIQQLPKSPTSIKLLLLRFLLESRLLPCPNNAYRAEEGDRDVALEMYCGVP